MSRPEHPAHDHAHDWYFALRSTVNATDGYQAQQQHARCAACRAELLANSAEHPNLDDHHWHLAYIANSCHHTDTRHACDCGATLSESRMRDPNAADTAAYLNPACPDCRWLAAEATK